MNTTLPNLDGEYESQLNLARKLILKIKDKSASHTHTSNFNKPLQRYLNTNSLTAVRVQTQAIIEGLGLLQEFANPVLDRGTALKYINIVTNLKSNDPTVKKNRNGFFKYFLKVLENQLTIEAKQNYCYCPFDNAANLTAASKLLQKEGHPSGEKVTSHWSKDKSSYVSAKILPGRGALLYMAVSSDPDCGWDVRTSQSASKQQ